eukprot:2898188-Prymnesium_polylepis.2
MAKQVPPVSCVLSATLVHSSSHFLPCCSGVMPALLAAAMPDLGSSWKFLVAAALRPAIGLVSWYGHEMMWTLVACATCSKSCWLVSPW